MNRPRPRHRHRYSWCRQCLGMVMLMCIRHTGTDPDFKFDFGKALLRKLRLTSFLKIHKLLWKRKILVHGHVRIFLNFVTFPLIVLIKFGIRTSLMVDTFCKEN